MLELEKKPLEGVRMGSDRSVGKAGPGQGYCIVERIGDLMWSHEALEL